MKLKLFQKKEEPTTQTDAVTMPATFRNEISYADSPYFSKSQVKPYNPDVLWQKFGDYSKFDDMRQDDQIKSALHLKKIVVLNADWEIECEEEDIKEFLDYALHNYLDDTFSKKLYEMLSSMDYGFSITEKIAGPVEYEGGIKWAFTSLKTRAPHGFELHTDKQGNLIKLLQHTSERDLELDPAKFILYAYNKEFDIPYGTSELSKGVYTAWFSKQALIKFLNIYLERYGSPLAVGRIPKSAGQSERDTFKTILKNIQAKTGITLPEGFELEYLSSNQGASTYKESIDMYNTMIARSMLLPDLLGFSGGQTAGGSYALGKEQFNIFYTAIEYIRQDLMRLINREIIKPLVEWNFGRSHEVVFKFNAVDEERKATDMKLWLEAVKSGKIPTNDESTNYFLRQVNFPEMTEEELAAIQAEKDAMKESIQDGIENKKGENGNEQGKDKQGDEVSEKDDKQKGNEGKPEKEYVQLSGTEKQEKQVSEFYRELTTYEKKAGIPRINKFLLAFEDTYVKELGAAVKLVVNGLINDIREKKIIERKKIELVNKLQLRNTQKIKKVIRDLLRDAANYGVETAGGKKKYIIDDTSTLLSNEEAAYWLGEWADYLADDLGYTIIRTVKPELLQAIRNGLGVKDAIKLLEIKLQGYDYDYDKSSLERIVRTNMNTAFNQARAQEFKNLQDDIIGYQYSAIMDARTSNICISLDQKIFPPEDLPKYNPPNHFNCRSLVIPIFKDEVSDDFDYDKMPDTVPDEENGFLTLTESENRKVEKQINEQGGMVK